MVHKGDIKIVSKMLRNLEEINGKVEFKAPLVLTAPTYNIIEELKDEVTGRFFRSIQGLNLMMMLLKVLQEQNTKIFFTWRDQAVIYVWEIRRRPKEETL